MSDIALSRAQRIAALREDVRAIESVARRVGGLRLPFGVEAIDRRLEGGGLAIAALHEMTGGSAAFGDDCAATLFTAALAARRAAAMPGSTVLWAMSRFDLFAPGLAGVGLGPATVLYAECRDDDEVLAVMEEGLRHGGLAAVVGEAGRAAMAATRRLQLAAEETGTLALMLKRRKKVVADPLAAPSAAMTRWRIASAPSAPLPHAGIGRPRWTLDLARQRGGEPYQWTMEAADAEGRLALPAQPADRPAAAERARQAA